VGNTVVWEVENLCSKSS